MNSASPRRTVSGPPTTEQASALSSIARARGSASRASSGSTGGGSLPGRPVRRFRKACCKEVNSRRASASVSAAKTFTPSITWGEASRSEGRKRSR